MNKLTVAHAVRCRNCGSFFSDYGYSTYISEAWFTSTPDKKYLRQGIRDKEFRKDCCKKPKMYIAKFKEVTDE